MSLYQFGQCYICKKDKALCDGVCAECASKNKLPKEFNEIFGNIFGEKSE